MKRPAIKSIQDRKTGKNIISVDYFRVADRGKTRFSILSYLIEDRNTIVHINTNLTSSPLLVPSEERDIIISFCENCSRDNFTCIMNPVPRTEKNGVFGKFFSKGAADIPAYDFMMLIPAGSFSREIFEKYMCTFFFSAYAGFELSEYDIIISDYKTAMITPENMHTRFDIEIFDAFEFNHMKIVSDRLDKKDFTDKIISV